MDRPAGPRRRRGGIAALGASALALAACGSGPHHVALPPEASPVGTFVPGALDTAGLADLLVVLGPATPGALPVTLFRQDGADPDELVDLGNIPGPAGPWSDPAVSLNDQWITLAWGSGGWVQRIGTDGPYGAPTMIALPPPVLRAVALGSRLVAVSQHAVLLYDVTAPRSPALLATFPLGVPATQVAAAGGGVFVFTTTGYGFVDPARRTYAAFDSPALKAVTSVQVYGGKLYVGGPSEIAGQFRIARLDPSAPPVLGVDVQNERIPDPDFAAIVDSAFDPTTGEYLLLAVPRDTGPNGLPSQLLRYRESGGALVLEGAVRLDTPVFPDGMRPEPPAHPGVLHAFGRRAYVVMGESGVLEYRLP